LFGVPLDRPPRRSPGLEPRMLPCAMEPLALLLRCYFLLLSPPRQTRLELSVSRRSPGPSSIAVRPAECVERRGRRGVRSGHFALYFFCQLRGFFGCSTRPDRTGHFIVSCPCLSGCLS
jgi:hypothetical protein